MNLTYGGSCQRLGVKVRQFIPPFLSQLFLEHFLYTDTYVETDIKLDTHIVAYLVNHSQNNLKTFVLFP